MKRIQGVQFLALFVVAGLSASCRGVDDALTAHSRPAATAAGSDLSTHTLGRIMAESPIPDSGLTAGIAEQVARLWADYVILANLYREPDTTESVDFTPLLDEGRYFAQLAVQRFRDSVLALDQDPTEEEVREYFDTYKPFNRLDLRRIVIPVPAGSSEEVRDSLYAEASVLRERLAGGADFVEVARERSGEPESTRGVVHSFQGHESVPEIADSALFAMRPGEISPVFATSEAMFIYRVEQVRVPEYDQARQMTFDRIVEERSTERQARTADSLLDAAQRSVQEGAPAAAMRIASEIDMAESSIQGSTPLVRFTGGSMTAQDLRRLFQAMPSLRDKFALATESEAEEYLLELATDEVLVQAAVATGFGPNEQDREELQLSMAARLAEIATQYEITHELVTDPSFRMPIASESFIFKVLLVQSPVPWLSEFRYVMDDYPAEVYERGAEAASRLARDLRGLSDPGPGTTAESPEDQTEHLEDAEPEGTESSPESDDVEPESVGS
jgi:hypothetical protein